jgi:hypothetical protein
MLAKLSGTLRGPSMRLRVRWPIALHGNKCLDLANVSSADGIRVQVWDCDGQSNQKWRSNIDGSIIAVGANKCLDAPNYSTANGVKLQIWSCTGATNQRWIRA